MQPYAIKRVASTMEKEKENRKIEINEEEKKKEMLMLRNHCNF